jgi:magnesium chelatase subunit I
LEQVAFEARDSEYVDAKSGVSARLTISAMENLMAAANLRLIESGEEKTSIRLVDFMSIIPSITGKIELVYEGEQEGATEVAKHLIDQAVVTEFEKLFPRIPNLEKAGVKTPYTDIITWFDSSNLVELNYTDTDEEFNANLLSIKPLVALVNEHCGKRSHNEKLFCMELVLWTLAVSNKLDRMESDKAFSFDATGSKQFFGDN